MRLIFLFSLIAILTFIHSAHSQDSTIYWTKGGNLGVNFSQVSLSNWSGGGNSTVSVTGLSNFFLNFKDAHSLWNNSVELGYGLTKLEGQEFRKSDDRIIVISQYGYKANEHLTYSGLLDFRTQFSKGFKYAADGKETLISNFLAPGFVTLSAGLTYRPSDWLEMMVAPVSNRLVLVMDDTLSQQGAFGVDRGKNVRSDLGMNFNLFLKKEIVQNVTFQTRFNVFAPYQTITTAIVTWETLLNLKVNDYITASFATDLLYDEKIAIQRDNGTIGPSTQFRSVLAIGFGYKF
ncbi:MAG TPA: DUF3078 domain-containing protein [Candidatus Kapabacteria bacterium]|nr:DUF3078 domain-containing protein [Ignavibacteria bacterium]HRE57066.1 DUF3078 domain-containing protein [Candidatus Kapabacteria bacterium]